MKIVSGCKSLTAAFLFGIAIIVIPISSEALDTTETWDVGATDLEFYTGYDGIGTGRRSGSVFSEMLIGYGIIEHFSAYFGATLQGNGFLADGNASFFMGIFGTPVDLDHFDLDLFLDMFINGLSPAQFVISPSTELNFDGDPERKTYGFYLRAGLPISGESVVSGLDKEQDYKVSVSIAMSTGAYMTPKRGHTLFVEYDMALNPLQDSLSPGGTRLVDIGGIALGYNVLLSDTIKMINEIRVDIPQSGENWSGGIMIGLVATLPQ